MRENFEFKSDPEFLGPKTTLVSRNITVSRRRTSVRLEPEMWDALREISRREQCTIHDICTLIHVRKNENTSLTAAIRVFLMLYYKASSTEEGHRRAGHGDFEFMKRRARIPDQMIQLFSKRKKGDVPYRPRVNYADNMAYETVR